MRMRLRRVDGGACHPIFEPLYRAGSAVFVPHAPLFDNSADGVDKLLDVRWLLHELTGAHIQRILNLGLIPR